MELWPLHKELREQPSLPKSALAAHARTTAVSLAVCLALAGCAHRTTAPGSLAGPGKPASVDNSWLSAARACWPDLGKNGYNTDDISRNLIHHLSAAFPSYSALTSNGADADLSMPITTVLAPDVTKLQHSQTPVLTRGQAVAGTPPQGAIVQKTDGNAPPDSLCSIQQGVPQGFSK